MEGYLTFKNEHIENWTNNRQQITGNIIQSLNRRKSVNF